MTATPDQSVLRELLTYEPSTGALTWRPRESRWFAKPEQHARWNTRFANKPALGSTQKGYRYVTLLSGKYLAHRIIWKWMTDSEAELIDHIDGDGLNNRWLNLRSVNSTDNCKNMKRPERNTSGHVGVAQRRGRPGIWRAYIYQNRRQVSLGEYTSFDAACEARQRAQSALGFHPNHGRSAATRQQSGGE